MRELPLRTRASRKRAGKERVIVVVRRRCIIIIIISVHCHSCCCSQPESNHGSWPVGSTTPSAKKSLGATEEGKGERVGRGGRIKALD